MLRDRQVKAVQYLDRVVEELFDIVPKNTYITITADHGELFGETAISDTVPSCTRRSSRCRSSKARSMMLPITPELAYIGPGAGFAFLGSFLTLLGGVLLGLISACLLWPFRMAMARRHGPAGLQARKDRS